LKQPFSLKDKKFLLRGGFLLVREDMKPFLSEFILANVLQFDDISIISGTAVIQDVAVTKTGATVR
jgi:hypothetical protein